LTLCATQSIRVSFDLDEKECLRIRLEYKQIGPRSVSQFGTEFPFALEKGHIGFAKHFRCLPCGYWPRWMKILWREYFIPLPQKMSRYHPFCEMLPGMALAGPANPGLLQGPRKNYIAGDCQSHCSAEEDVRGEMVAASDAREADCTGQAIGHDGDPAMVAVAMSDDGGD
jgi:hypothetical protein